jgi:KTSC domain
MEDRMSLVWHNNFTSSNIAAIAWDGAVWVKFQTGAVYTYPDATKEQFDAFLQAESKGSFFSKTLRKQRCEQIVRMTLEEARRNPSKMDWAKFDATTDEQINRQIEADPDLQGFGFYSETTGGTHV